MIHGSLCLDIQILEMVEHLIIEDGVMCNPELLRKAIEDWIDELISERIYNDISHYYYHDSNLRQRIDKIRLYGDESDEELKPYIDYMKGEKAAEEIAKIQAQITA